MTLDSICLKVGKLYIAKNNIENKGLFNKGIKDSLNDKYDLYPFIKNHQTISDYELGGFLRLVTRYLFQEENLNIKSPKEVNNIVEKISSIDLNEYIKLIKESKKNVKPIKFNAITIKTSEKYLRQKSKKVSFNDNNLLNDIKILEDFCKDGNVLAMAAVQLGITKRIIYIKNTNLELVNKFQTNQELPDNNYDEQRVLINPKIIKETGLTEYWEACASCLDNMGHVYRPHEIEIEYYDLHKKKHKVTFKGFESTVLSHEYDHLNGILHMDRADEVLVMDMKKRGEFRQSHKYNIISQEGNYPELLKNMQK